MGTHSREGIPKSQHARDRPQNPASSFPHPKFCSFTAPVHPPPPLSQLHHPRNSRGTPSKEPLDGAVRPSLVVPGGGKGGSNRKPHLGGPGGQQRGIHPPPSPGTAVPWIPARLERPHCGSQPEWNGPIVAAALREFFPTPAVASLGCGQHGNFLVPQINHPPALQTPRGWGSLSSPAPAPPLEPLGAPEPSGLGFSKDFAD